MDTTATAREVRAAIEGLVEDTNAMWASGEVAERSSVRHVVDDLVAVQYAPHYEGGVWQAGSGREWVAGTAEAAASLRGQGCTWTVHDVNVLPRSEDECIASYRVVHAWGDAERRPAQAFFLETWRRGVDGTWRLARHTAEKV
jgi:hypothetical protein